MHHRNRVHHAAKDVISSMLAATFRNATPAAGFVVESMRGFKDCKRLKKIGGM